MKTLIPIIIQMLNKVNTYKSSVVTSVRITTDLLVTRTDRAVTEFKSNHLLSNALHTSTVWFHQNASAAAEMFRDIPSYRTRYLGSQNKSISFVKAYQKVSSSDIEFHPE